MSNKMECPGCGSVSSSVLIKVQDGEPCPFCGLSAAAVTEISRVRQKRGDDDLKRLLSEAYVALDRVRSDNARLQRIVTTVRSAVREDT